MSEARGDGPTEPKRLPLLANKGCIGDLSTGLKRLSPIAATRGRIALYFFRKHGRKSE